MQRQRSVTGEIVRASARALVGAFLAALSVAAGGCYRPSLPEMNLATPAPAKEALDVEVYLRARYGEWVYDRVELGSDEKRSPTRYIRRATPDRLSEGILAHRALPSLERYMRGRRPRSSGPRPAEGVSAPSLPAHETPQLFELERPLAPIPLELAETSPIVNTSTLRYYDRRGRLEMTGEITRRVWIEGTQDVDCPAGHFAGCLRLKLELEISFPFGPRIDWASYLWLSREVGEVRRIEEFSGKLWIFGFGSAHEYLLVSHSAGTASAPAGEPAPKWSRGLMTLDRPVPHPRISGMVVDFAASQPAE